MHTFAITDIRAAHERIRSGIYRSPCPKSIALSDLTGSEIFCKLDFQFVARSDINSFTLLGTENDGSDSYSDAGTDQ